MLIRLACGTCLLLTMLTLSRDAVPTRARNPAERPECPDHEFFTRGRQNNWTANLIAVLGIGSNIPEFNDCQALVRKNEYGPLVAIMARQNPVPSQLPRDRFYLAAVIYNYGTLADGNVSYGTLGIKPGVSCLYVPIDKALGRAYLIPRPLLELCKDNTNTPAATPALELRIRPKQVATDTVPRAARWEWDPNRLEQYIGVACDGEWCEIGRKGFRSAPDPDTRWVPSAPGPGSTMSAAHRIRGYFDEQELAVPKPGASPTDPLMLSGVRATFFPAPNLGVVTDFKGPRYVGTMIINKHHTKYEKMYGLVPGKATHVFLVRKTDAAGNPLLYDDGTERFQAVFETNGALPVKKDFKRRSHPGPYGVPPMVRWRWKWDDETTWVKCLEGCCSTE
jgi:hypothetical protein